MAQQFSPYISVQRKHRHKKMQWEIDLHPYVLQCYIRQLRSEIAQQKVSVRKDCVLCTPMVIIQL